MRLLRPSVFWNFSAFFNMLNRSGLALFDSSCVCLIIVYLQIFFSQNICLLKTLFLITWKYLLCNDVSSSYSCRCVCTCRRPRRPSPNTGWKTRWPIWTDLESSQRHRRIFLRKWSDFIYHLPIDWISFTENELNIATHLCRARHIWTCLWQLRDGGAGRSKYTGSDRPPAEDRHREISNS